MVKFAIANKYTNNQTDDKPKLSNEPAKSGGRASSGGGSPRPAPVQNSVNAYHDINRTLGNFHEKPREDPEKERLQAELDELRDRLDRQEKSKNVVDEQMAVMEKSFQMAQKYLPSGVVQNQANTENGAGTTATGGTTNGKMVVVPVSQVVEQAVSALPQEMTGKDVIQAFSKPRNLGFFTATAETFNGRKNTISACISADQTLMDGESVRLRQLEPMRVGKTLVRENTILSGVSKIQGERLQITVYSMEYGGNIIPVEMAVYDTDGQKGIFIPDTKEVNAAKEIAANMGTNAGTSISLSTDAGEQFAADMGRNAIQGISQFFSKKMREVKVNLKAGGILCISVARRQY